MNTPVYLDNSATTPMDPRVLEAMLPYFTQHFGNAASRNHKFGWVAEEGVDYAREQVGKIIGASDKEIIFTSGATEADNLALKGVAEMYARKGRHIVTVVTEHKAVLDTARRLAKEGCEVTFLKVGPDGLLDLNEVQAAIRPDTILVSVMFANNETGVIQPIREIAALAHAQGALFMTDATQAVGKVPINVDELGIDLLAFTAHKMYGPKGVGPRWTAAATSAGCAAAPSTCRALWALAAPASCACKKCPPSCRASAPSATA
jgi:cysteine desulfurase